MCGIGGCVLAPGGPDQDRLAAMRDAFAHRGPDDSGIQVIDNVGLVHTRLSIVDLSARGHQPMAHPGGDWWIAYNGEIYNHPELRRELEREGAEFVGDSDTETLLWALERWGQPVVTPAERPVRVRRARPARAARAAVPRPLRDQAAVSGAVRRWRVVGQRAGGADRGRRAVPSRARRPGEELSAGAYLGGEETLLDGITRLAPGSWAEISLEDAEMKTDSWHEPVDDVDPALAARLKRRSRARARTELESTLREAVHGTLLADTTVGTLCSGGVDSSLITAFAVEADAGHRGVRGKLRRRREEGRGPCRPARRRCARDPSRAGRGDPRELASPVRSGDRALRRSDRERERGDRRAARRPRRDDVGSRCLLTGEGADELFGGYTKLHAASLAAFLPWHNRVVQAAEPTLCSDPMRALNPMTVLRKTRELVREAVGPAESRWLPVSTPDTNHQPTPESILAYAHHSGDRGQLEAGLLSHLDYSLCWLLNRMDKNVMQASVEARVPFLEPEVVKLVLNLPLEARVGPWSKGILRDVARRVLPWSIAHRPKIYGMAFDARTWIEEAANPAFLTDGLLRDTLRIPEDDFKNVVAAGNHVVRVRLWSAEVWCRSMLAGHSIEQIEQDLWARRAGDPVRPLPSRHVRGRRVGGSELGTGGSRAAWP